MVVTEVDDWSWWTSISDDIDVSQVPDEVWDAALTTALDPDTALVSEDLIPGVDVISEELGDIADDMSGDVAFVESSYPDGDDVSGHDDGVLSHADEFDDGDDDGDPGFVGM